MSKTGSATRQNGWTWFLALGLVVLPFSKVVTAAMIWLLASLSMMFDFLVYNIPSLSWFFNGFILFAGTHFAFQLAHLRYTRALHVLFSLSLLWIAVPLTFWDSLPWNKKALYPSPPVITKSSSGKSKVESVTKPPQPTSVSKRVSLPPANTQRWIEPYTATPLIRIPGGCFYMGSPADEVGREKDEGPVVDVCLTPFFLAEKETTRGAFQRFVQATGYTTQAEQQERGEAQGCRAMNANKEWESRTDINWRRTGELTFEDHPVVCVTWNDASRFINWLNQLYGAKVFHLPSEAQWEYAARAGTTTPTYWGDEESQACLWENLRDQSYARETARNMTHFNCDDHSKGLAITGSRQANPFGLFDMLGNAREWVNDGYHVYSALVAFNPTGSRFSRFRMARGAHWNSSQKDFVRFAARYPYEPDFAWTNLGFRLAMSDSWDLSETIRPPVAGSEKP